jgi:hypothetical protein
MYAKNYYQQIELGTDVPARAVVAARHVSMPPRAEVAMSTLHIFCPSLQGDFFSIFPTASRQLLQVLTSNLFSLIFYYSYILLLPRIYIIFYKYIYIYIYY